MSIVLVLIAFAALGHMGGAKARHTSLHLAIAIGAVVILCNLR